MGDTTVTFTNASKEIYEDEDVLQQQQNLISPFFAKIKKSNKKPSIKGVFDAIIMAGDETGGAINENESFPAPLPVVIQEPSVQSKTCVYPLEISKKLMALASDNKQAFAEAYDTKVMDTRTRAISDINRMSYGTGTGQITLANGAATSTSLVVDDPFAFRVGFYIDAFDTIGGTKQIDNIQVTAVNLSTSTLTLASTQTWSDNAIICKAHKMDGVTSQANAKEIMGWRGIADVSTFSTTFEGVNTTTYPSFTGNVIDAASAPISEDFLQRVFNQIAVISGKKPDTLLSNYGQHRVFKNTEIQKTRYEPGKIIAGNTELKWGDLTWIRDHTCPIAEVAQMNLDGLRRFEVYNLRLSDVGNGNTQYQVYGRHQIGSYFEYEGNIGVWRRNDQGRGINLQEPTF